MQAGSGGVFSEATLCFEPTARTLKPQRPVCTRPITARNEPARVATTFRCQVAFGCGTVTVTRTFSLARKCAPLTIIGSLADTSLIAGFRVAPEDREKIRLLAQSMVRSLLRRPTSALKEESDPVRRVERAEAIRHVFGLEDEDRRE